MRKLILLATFFLLVVNVQAQKYACVNTEYIMSNVPEYNQVLTKVNKYVEEWRKELEAKQAEVDELRQQYQQEAYLLPDNLKQRRQDEIRTKEAELRNLQQQRFAPGGDLDQKRAELMKPVQDRIYNAIERVAREKNYAFVFDKSASATLLYAGEKYDISNQVLEILGVKPTSNPPEGISSGSAARSPDTKSSGGSKNKQPDNMEKREVRR
jgi:outer membrane protein